VRGRNKRAGRCHRRQARGVRARGRPARPLPVTVPVTALTPSRAQREPAPVDRIATSRAPSTNTVTDAHRPEEKGALGRTHWLGVSQAGIRASHFPQSATCQESRPGQARERLSELTAQDQVGHRRRPHLLGARPPVCRVSHLCGHDS